MNQFFISCKESRVEHNRSFYGCFYLGPFDQGQSLTVANALRRTLLSELSGFAITSVEIEGVLHEYSTIPGVRDTVLDILLNLKEIVIKPSASYATSTSPSLAKLTKQLASQGEEETKDEKKSVSLTDLEMKDDVFEDNVAIGYLQVRGPGVVRSGDLKLPPHFQCVDPDQYIATLSDDGLLNLKFEISKGKNYQIRSHEMILNSFVPEETKNRQLWLKKIKTGTVRHHKTMNDSTDESLRYRVPSSPSPPLRLGSPLAMAKKERKPQLSERSEATRLNTRELENAKNRGSSKLFIDAVFMPVTKVNYIIELAEPYYQNESPPSKKHTIILEIWTNGSLHPRKALYDSLKKLVNIFSKLYNVKFLGSMLRSNRTYEKMLHKFNLNIESSSLGKPRVAGADAAQDGAQSPSANPSQLEAGRKSLQKTSLRSSPEAKKVSSARRSKGEEGTYLASPKAKGLRTQADDQGFASENNRRAAASSASDLRSRPSAVGASLGGLLRGRSVALGAPTAERSMGALRSMGEATSSPQRKPQSKSNRLLEDIGTLKLSLRAYSCLKNNNINTIGDLLQYSPQQLLTFKNLGQRSLEEVQKTLGQIGFSLLP